MAAPSETSDLRREKKVAAVHLDASQEDALSRLSGALFDCTSSYEKALEDHDEQSAQAWSAKRLNLLREMANVIGGYRQRFAPSMPKDRGT
jgi:hypothetical protein